MTKQDWTNNKIYKVMNKICNLYKDTFTITHLGIRYLKNILNEYDNMYDTKRIPIITFLINAMIAIVAVFVSLAEYEQLPILLLNLFIVLVVIWVVYSLRKF